MDRLLGHRQTKGAATDNAEPNATAPHLDSTGSGSSALYHPNGRFRVHTGRYATIFRNPKTERLLFPKAVVQNAENTRF